MSSNDTEQQEDSTTTLHSTMTQTIFIESPQSQDVVFGDSIEVIGQAYEATEVLINQAKVNVINNRFQHTLALPIDASSLMIEVSTSEEIQRRTVHIDRDPPTLLIESPQRGEMIQRSTEYQIRVAGTAVDPSGIAVLTVNGQITRIDATGHFETVISAEIGMNSITIEVEDQSGAQSKDVRAVIYGDFNPFEKVVRDAVTLRLDKEALDRIADDLGDQIDENLFANLGGMIEEGAFDIRDISIGDKEIILTPGNGTLEIELKLYALRLDFEAEFEGRYIRGDIDAHPAIIKIETRFITDGLGGLDLEIINASATMENFDFDIDGLLGLFDWLIRGIVKNQLEKGLTDALRTQVITGLLDADALDQTADLLGYPAFFDLALVDLGIDPTGIEIMLDMGIEILHQPLHSLPGYFSTPLVAPIGAGDGMLRLNLADDFINMILAQYWLANGLKIDLGDMLNQSDAALPIQLNARTLSSLLSVPQLLDHVNPESEVGLSLLTKAPPIMQALKVGPKAQVDLPEMELTFTVDHEGRDLVWAMVIAHLTIEVTRDMEDNLSFDTHAVINIVKSPLFPINENEFSDSLNRLFGLIPSLITQNGGAGLLSGIGGMNEPNVVSDGLGIIIENFHTYISGVQGGYLTFDLDLGLKIIPDEAPELEIIQTEINPINGHTYHLLESSNWSDAEAFAVSLGGHLATVRSREENQWILSTFGRQDRDNRDLWIGLHDAYSEGHWVWTSGEDVTYTNFDRKQPDNGVEEEEGQINEDYVHLYGDRSKRRNGKWNDSYNTLTTSYNDGFYGVVELPIDPILQP